MAAAAPRSCRAHHVRAPRAISPRQVNLERDIGLGKLMYATWFDNFNIVQFTILIVALIEGLIEHRLHKTNRESACLTLQRVWSWTVMVGLYPLCTAGVLVAGAYDETLGYLIVGIGLPLIVIVFVYSLRRLFYEGIRLRRKVAKDLSECDRASPAFPSLLQFAFNAYDIDSSVRRCPGIGPDAPPPSGPADDTCADERTPREQPTDAECWWQPSLIGEGQT